MTPTQLRTYVSIVRNGTSKAAAVELGVSEPAVSSHVAALRKELNDVLFERVQGRLQFTPGGLRLASRAVELLGLQDQTRNEVRLAADGRRLLRLGVSSLFGEYAAPGLIEGFSRRANDLSVEMSVHPPSDFASLLAARAIDVAVGPSSPAPNEDIRIKEFLRYALVLVTGPKSPLAKRRVRTAELAQASWFLGPSAIDRAGIASQLLERFEVPELNQRIFQSHAAAVSACREKGLAIVPVQYLSDQIESNRLAVVDVPGGQGAGVWCTQTLRPDLVSPASKELVRFISTPKAVQYMLRGQGANISQFRPRVHVTLWS